MESLSRPTPIIDSKMIQGLEVIHLENTILPGYPGGKCIEISREVAGRYGLVFNYGFFLLDFRTDERSPLDRPHAWCEDGNRTIIDLTASQFNTNLFSPIPRGLMLIKPEDELYGRYRKLE